jgi:competence protein ComEA
MLQKRRDSDAGGTPWLLRRRDQAALAGLVLVALVVLVVAWWMQGGASGELVEIDEQSRRVATFSIDINHAPWTELSQLPGIGEALARRIVESREKEGPYKSHDDLGRVKGIGPKTIERMRPFLKGIEK